MYTSDNRKVMAAPYLLSRIWVSFPVFPPFSSFSPVTTPSPAHHHPVPPCLLLSLSPPSLLLPLPSSHIFSQQTGAWSLSCRVTGRNGGRQPLKRTSPQLCAGSEWEAVLASGCPQSTPLPTTRALKCVRFPGCLWGCLGVAYSGFFCKLSGCSKLSPSWRWRKQHQWTVSWQMNL